jgi:hypothetical protein
MSEAKWFTGARKFPQLIGRTPDGGKLLGGPYTITQVVIAVVGIVVLANTTWLWMRFSLMGNLVVPGALAALVWSAGKLPFGMRNPVIVGSGWLKAVERLISAAPLVRLRRPHQVRSAALMITSADSELAAPGDLADSRPVDQVAHNSAPPPLTGVQQLLAARR